MAKKRGALVIKLLSVEGTGTFYMAKKNPKTQTTKMEVRKYDSRIRKHVLFREAKSK